MALELELPTVDEPFDEELDAEELTFGDFEESLLAKDKGTIDKSNDNAVDDTEDNALSFGGPGLLSSSATGLSHPDVSENDALQESLPEDIPLSTELSGEELVPAAFERNDSLSFGGSCLLSRPSLLDDSILAGTSFNGERVYFGRRIKRLNVG